MKKWLDGYDGNVELNTYEGYQYVVERYIIPYFLLLKLSLCDVKPYHIKDYYNYLKKAGLSERTIRKHHANIHKALKDAVSEETLSYNPADADKVSLPSLKKSFTPNFYKMEKSTSCSILCAVRILRLLYALRSCSVSGAANLPD